MAIFNRFVTCRRNGCDGSRRRLTGVAIAIVALALSACAKDITISIPKHTKPTPVQKLNQEGVREIQKQHYKKAKALFYKAYLIDPNDPFTLNNLGYIAELEGQVDRAQRYYELAQEQNSDAVVYKSTERAAIGQPVDKIAGNAADAKMQINRINVYAINLLQKDHAPEADLELQKALKLDPNDPFTLNNLGYAREKRGRTRAGLRLLHPRCQPAREYADRSHPASVVARKADQRDCCEKRREGPRPTGPRARPERAGGSAEYPRRRRHQP